MTLLTALIIQNREIRCEAGGPCTQGEPHEIGKWVGWIMIDEERWSPLLNTPPIYDSEQQATQEMEALVAKIRETDFGDDVERLRNIIGEAAPIINKIIQGANTSGASS
jgi:hypothetical protein